MASGSVKERLERALLVCRSEWGPLLWMVGLNFLLCSGATLGFCIINAIFMSAIYRNHFGLHVFPLAFLIGAILLVPYYALYNHLERNLPRKIILSASFGIYGLFMILFAYMLSLTSSDYSVVLWVFVLSSCILFLVNLQFWSFANLIFHPRQGKRLFPLVGMGGILGAAVTGFMIKYFILWAGSSSRLLYLWGGIFLACSVLVLLIYRFHKVPEEKLNTQTTNVWAAIENDYKIIDRLPLLRVMAGVIFVMSVTSFIIYFKFNSQLSTIFAREDDFAAFMGDFNGTLNITILLYQLFLTGHLVSGMGVINSLFLHPGMMAIPILGVLAAPAHFVPLIAARFVDELSKETIFQTVSESIYGSVPDASREQAMSFMKIIVTPLSIGVSALVMAIVYKAFPETAGFVSSLIIPIMLILFIFYIWHLKDLYIDTLFGNFVSGDDQNRLESFRALTQLKGARTKELLQRTLTQGSRRMQLFALELAGEMKITGLKKEIFDFLEKDDEGLKTQAIASLGRIGGKDLYPRLIKVYNTQSSAIKLLILENLQLIDSWNFGINASLLIKEEKDPLVQGYLLEYLWSKKELLTEQKEIFTSLLNSENPFVRKNAASCLRFDRERIFENQLARLLEDEDPSVIREAAASAGQTGMRNAVPRLMDLLDSSDALLAETALKALVKIRVDVAEKVIESINEDEPAGIIGRKLRIIAHIGDAGQQYLLLQKADSFLPEAVAPAIEIMARELRDYRTFSRQEQQAIRNFINGKALQIRDEFKAAYALKRKFKDYKEPVLILMMLLKERIDTLRRIILLGLHLLKPHEKILTIMENIFSGDLRKKNIAVEALENLLPVEYKRIIIPLFEKDSLEEEMDYIVDLYNLETDDYNRMLDILTRYGDNWIKAWAFYTAGMLKLESWKPLMEEALLSKDQLLAEHADYGLRLLNGENGINGGPPPVLKINT